jgi:hypothetical protein
MSEVRADGEASLSDLPGEVAPGGTGAAQAPKDPLFEFGFKTTTQAIELMRSLAATGMDGAAKMGCVIAVIDRGLKNFGPQIPVPSWAKVAQSIVARIVVAMFGRMFAGVIEAIYQQTIRKPNAEPESK